MSEATILMVGDLVLDVPEIEPLFNASRATLRAADLVVGHVEVPHTLRGTQSVGNVPAPLNDPQRLEPLQGAGFHLATLAGNHIYDQGPLGISDTIDKLRSLGIEPTGAGPNLEAARKPAIAQRNGIRVGVLSYNCVGPRESWASANKAGCAYVHVMTHYEVDYAGPGGPPQIYTFAEPSHLEAMQGDIERLREQADIVIVALHKGLGHTPAVVGAYERQIAKGAIDAGADIVIGHHAHILRGVETYKGKPIFHGLGNFVTVTRALAVEDNASPERLAWAKRRRALFGFEPDPNYPTYPFHPEAKNTMIASCTVTRDGVKDAGFLPCWVKPNGEPEVLGRDARGIEVAAYIEKITQDAGLKANFRWDGDRVVFT
ncbi:CapA family protein [Roseiterribacter gracilis]|uniref:Capsule synthesis protein CapA domain-containing protein n=1 Tax=Roseiterribacter gracilis TaxID=2812848 RepID=A0A8S8XIV4_9PROT|nr:hypothetical protein TMPK1_38340 [Rhodospirillales bacterium TMPK1]